MTEDQNSGRAKEHAENEIESFGLLPRDAFCLRGICINA